MKTKLALLLVLLMVASMVCAGCGESADVVTINVLNWGDYIDEDLIGQFTE